MKASEARQPLSAKAYALIAMVGLVLSAGLLVEYLFEVPRLVESGTQSQVFYLLLIPWALSCSAFLFGAMRSYGQFTHKRIGNTLELGGPVVLFGLVLLGGFKLVPAAPEMFDLTIRAHSADELDPMVKSGELTLELGAARRTVEIDSAGEANFKGIPSRFKGSTLRVLPQVEGYEKQWVTLVATGDAFDIKLARSASPVIVLTGSITPLPATVADIKILVDGQKAEASPDEFGRFELRVKGTAGDRVRLKVYQGRNLLKDDYYVLPGPASVNLDKLR